MNSSMRDDFCVFILTHGRPGKVHTVASLKRAGYTGPVFIVVDDEDSTIDGYRKLYGDAVKVFSKKRVAKTFDEADTTGDRRSIVYARNYVFGLARELGFRYFIQLDDDYNSFSFRYTGTGIFQHTAIRSMNAVLGAMVEFYERADRVSSFAMAQGGDFFGGCQHSLRFRRKCMNSFICSTDRPFKFQGRINEDVSTYTEGSRRGLLFFTTLQVALCQNATQHTRGGMTDLYVEGGTYLKTFYSVMYAPSGVKVGTIADPSNPSPRLHHDVCWPVLAPKILREHNRKTRDGE